MQELSRSDSGPGKKFCISQVLQDVAVVSENQNNNWINQEKNGPLCLEIHFEVKPAVRKIRAPEALVPTTASAAPTAVPCESFPRESLSSELLISARPSSLLPREA
ncbi:hypothetical protein HZH66_013760 [Vespula vulgaris]|uniref:Uncharacterized protein n=1 Tax=Vespula vulgaris TaxID=7454 RepID=A0A834J3I1_VESVU|nr:hypothetical protein HZH66_013760 [Vespula vulgaris]